jgi:hypothetical protein
VSTENRKYVVMVKCVHKDNERMIVPTPVPNYTMIGRSLAEDERHRTKMVVFLTPRLSLPLLSPQMALVTEILWVGAAT